MNKFIYEKNDIDIAHSQCEFCIYNDKASPDKCEKYEKKPDEIIKNIRQCPLSKDDLPTPW